MNNHIQLVLKSSTTELPLNDREYGIYLVPELEGLTGLPEIRTTSGVNAGYDGGWTSAQNYDARSITIRGVIANTDVATVERLRRQLTALAGQGKKEELTLDLVTEAGNAYTVQVRTIALEMALQKVVYQQEFMLQLRADDPLIYDASETGHEALLQVAQATGGFTIDFELPLAITGSSEETIVNNEGLEQVPTITRMYGELHNPKIINQTTNQFMQIEADLGFAEGDWIEPSEVVSGKDITINGAPEGAPLSSIQIDGNTTQQTYTGKNLLNTHGTIDTDSLTGSGVSYTINADGTISTSGSNSGAYKSIRFLLTLPAGTYKFSGCPSGGTNNGYSFCVEPRGDSTLQLFDTGNGNEFTLTEQKTIRAYPVRIGADTGVNMNGKVFKPMITVSTAEQTYEPYTNGPAPNPDYPQAVQTVTGENVVKICGKNLFDKNSISTGYLNADGTLRSDSAYKTSDFIAVKPNTAYYKTYTASPRAKYYNSTRQPLNTTTYQDIPIGGAAGTFTTPANAAYVRFSFPVAGVNLDTTQLELGSTATAYEPYQGQSYEVNLGKNLFDKDNASEVINAFIDYGAAAHKIYNNSSCRLAYIRCEPNTTYTISKTLSARFVIATTSEVPANNVSVSQDIAKNTDTTYTITTNSTAKYLCVFLYHSSYDTLTPEQILATLQIEAGSQATSYAPYFTPIELCKIGTYQDYIYKSGGKWYVHKVVSHRVYDWNVLGIAANNTSSETTASAEGAFQVFFSDSSIPNSDKPNMRLSENAGIYNSSQTISGNADARSMTDGTFKPRDMSGTVDRIYFRNTGYIGKTGNEVKAILVEKTGGIGLWWFKTTPTDTEITNEALVGQLEALAAATMYNPQTNITTLYADGNEQPTLDVSYFTDKNPDTRDELVIDSRLRTITLNGLDVYHLQAPGSEFLMLAPGENRLSLQSDITGDNGYAQVSYKQGYLSI